MTLRQFAIMWNEISNIAGDDEQKNVSLTGDAGFALAKRIFPRGKK